MSMTPSRRRPPAVCSVVLAMTATGVVGCAAGSPTPTATPSASAVVFAAGGDFGATTATTATMTSIAAGDAQFLLALGDLAYKDATAAQWCDYVKGHLGADFPVQLLVGNHEDDDRVDGYIGDFAACLPDRMNSVGTYAAEYYFDVDNLARFIMIGAGNDVAGIKYDYARGNTHYQWLSDTIDDARAAGIRWVIVGAHKPCITAGLKTCEVGSDLYDLLIDKRVDLVLHGHEHNYQRSKQLTCATPNTYRPECIADDGADGRYTKGVGTIFAITGASGGSGHYEINSNDPEIGYLAAWQGANSPDAGRGYTQISLDPTTLTLDYIGTTTTYTDHATIGPGVGIRRP